MFVLRASILPQFLKPHARHKQSKHTHKMTMHRLITKPEQSGKTFIMLREMITIVEGELEGDQKNINLVFCDNNLMLVLQTLERV